MIDVIPEPDLYPGNGAASLVRRGAPEARLFWFRRMTSDDELFVNEVLMINSAGDVTVGVMCSADLSGDITVGVASSTDLAGDITNGVASLADLAGVVTIGVADHTGVVAIGTAFMEECGESDVLLSDYVSEYEDFIYVGRFLMFIMKTVQAIVCRIVSLLESSPPLWHP